MTLRKLAVAAIALSGMIQPLAAQEIDPVRIARVADRPAITLDSAKAYLLLETTNGGVQANFLLTPTAEERADWARQRAEALAEAIERYPRRLSSYQSNLRIYRETQGRVGRLPEMPVEPTEANFDWPDIEQHRQIVTGPANRFFEERGYSLWLYEVPAGEYTFYSIGMPGMGDCACMGSVSFSAETGRVTALQFGAQPVDGAGLPIDRAPEGTQSNDVVTRTAMVVEPASDRAYDPRIPRAMIHPAYFVPVARLPNWVGSTINRILPIPGVLRYENGRVVDERAADTARP